MSLYKRVFRKVGIWAGLGGLGAASLLLAATARGQSSPPAAAYDAHKKPKIYTNKNLFHLPVQIDQRTRGNLREVCLYVKAGSGDWVRQETGHPGVTHFSYRATQDGEYWFSVVTIDKNGRPNPADVAQEPPGLQVVVDTQEPSLELQPAAVAGETMLRATMQDANPDLASVRLVYRGSDQADHTVEPVAGRPGYFRVPTDAWNRPVLVKGTDRCGNAAVREFQLRNPQLARQTPSAAVPVTIKPDAPAPSTSPTEHVVATGFKNESPAVKPEPSPEPVLPKPSEVNPKS